MNFKLKIIIAILASAIFALMGVPAFAQNTLVDYGQFISPTGGQTATLTQAPHTQPTTSTSATATRHTHDKRKSDTQRVRYSEKGHRLLSPTPSPIQNLAQLGQTPSNPIVNTLAQATSYILTLGNPVHFTNPKKSFSPAEKPSFALNIPVSDKTNVGESKTNMWQTTDEAIQAKLISKTNNKEIPAIIQKNAAGQFEVTVQSTDNMPHGDYSLQVDAKESIVYTRDLTQDFSWGVLSVNTNKSMYTPGETAHLYFGIVDQRGHTLCRAKIEAIITSPDGNKTNFSTENGTIKRSKECAGDSYVNTPDYAATYQTAKTGVYQMVVTGANDNGTHTISDFFVVRDSVPFSIDRSAFPSRMYPVAQYPVTIKITANEDYSGIVSDSIPQPIKVSDISDNGQITQNLSDNNIPPTADIAQEDAIAHQRIQQQSLELYEDDATTEALLTKQPNAVVWHVNWKEGQTYTLSYTLNFPPKSPAFYLLGPFTVGQYASDETKVQTNFTQQTQSTEQSGDIPQPQDTNIIFQEIRQWQVAGDATICWDGTAGGNWSTGTNWVGNAAPGSTDTATFDNAGATCPSGNNNNSTIDSSFGGTVQGMLITATYTGTISNSKSGFKVTNSNYSQANGTFSGGSVGMTIGSTNTVLDSFTLSGGTFNSTSGTLTIEGTYNTTGGTFNAGTGTVLFQSTSTTQNGFTITPSTETYNNVTFDVTGGPGETFVIASGTNLSINGTLKFIGLGSATTNYVNGPGGINLQGNIDSSVCTDPNDFAGSAIINIDGTGTQSITGVSGGSGGQGSVPAININKSSGTLNIRNFVAASTNWTWTQGTVDYTGSTVAFTAQPPGNVTIVPGPTAFNNVNFDGQYSGAQDVYTIQNGSTLTIGGTLTLLGAGLGQTGAINGNISAQGDITTSGTDPVDFKGSAIITINGSGTQTFTGVSSGTIQQGAIPSIVINKTSGTLNIRNNITAVGSWTWTQGAEDFTGSTIFFDGEQASGGTITPGPTAFNIVTIDNKVGGTFTYTIPSGSALTAAGTFTLADSGGGHTTINGPGVLSPQGNFTTSSANVNGNAGSTLSGSSSQTITQSGTNTFPTGSWTVNKSGGTATLASALTINSASQSLTISGGTLDLAGQKLTIGSSGTLTMNGGTLSVRGSELIRAGTSTLNSPTLTGGTVNYYGTGTYAKMILGTNYYNLTISGSGSWTAATSSAVLGNFTMSAGTYTAPTILTVGGNFQTSGGTFTNNSGTVVFNDNTQTNTITGTNTFYNLTVATPAKLITFPASVTTTVSHTMQLQGAATGHVTLRSSTPGTQATLTASGSYIVNAVDVEDSNVCSSSTTPITASNSINSGDNSCWSFPTSDGGWYSTSWRYRKKIVINHTKVPADQTNFPVLITWSSDSNVAAQTQSNGNDILFTQSDGTTQLSHEIENYVSTTGELEAWVKIPTLSSSTDTVLYMYYGNAGAANQQNATAVWSNGYVMVQHLGETSGTLTNDSSGNSNSGTKRTSNSPSKTSSGIIDGAQSFNGTSDYITVAAASDMSFTQSQDYTISAWINLQSLPGAWATIAEKSRDSSPWYGLWVNSSNQWAFGGGAGQSANIAGTSASTGIHYLVGVQQGSVIRTLYVDGQSNATGSVQDANGTSYMQIGADHFSGANDEYFPGVIDEVRVSNVARSAQWIQTEYNNIASPSAFFATYQDNKNLTIGQGMQIKHGVQIKSN